ncbi:PTS fructose transporter subunit IIC [Amphibacillus sp. Q70]|uniref:PTS fructose transporter subunit IIC n=1 Tax=Amphibacillus sp. Q70 TaxID=3453416 RepID=UPI003F86BE2F
MSKLNIKQHIMTGISYMVPIVVAGGICMAIARIFGGAFVGDAIDTVPWMINSIGQAAMGFVVPVLTAGIAYSIADRPGIAPGLALGFISTELRAGFLGGLLMGLIVGYFINWIKTWKVPSYMKGLMPILIIPVVSTFTTGLVFYLIIGQPIVWLQDGITNWMYSLQGGSKFILGSIVGGMMGVDMGGPINKTSSAFATSLVAEGIYGPSASRLIGGMTPALGIGISVLLRKNRFTKAEIDMAKAAFPMGLCYITEGVLPFAAADPIRVIVSSVAGSALGGGLSMLWGVESVAVHGGIFVVPAMVNPIGFLMALVIGSVTTGVLYAVLRQKPQVSEDEEIVDLDIDISLQN